MVPTVIYHSTIKMLISMNVKSRTDFDSYTQIIIIHFSTCLYSLVSTRLN